MKTYLMILVAGALVLPAIAQDTNEIRKVRSEKKHDWKKGSRPEISPEDKEKMHAQRLQLMEKSLEEIGITEEQRKQIAELQLTHREKMKSISQKADEARKNLSTLQDKGASEAELDTAIDAVTDAQSGQLKLLVKNRLEMEKILGKEKYTQFMDNARQQFRKHGRRGGSGMPPRPPSAAAGDSNPPPVPQGSGKQAPPSP